MIKVRLKEILKEKGMTMTELHQKTGISQNALSLLANGKSNGIQFNTLEKIITATNTSIEDLLDFVGEKYKLYVEYVEESIDLSIHKGYIYEVFAKDQNSVAHSAKLCVRYSLETLNSRKTLLIAFRKNIHRFTNDFLNDIFFNNRNKDILKTISYLIAFDIVNRFLRDKLENNSLILFSWFGFLPLDPEETLFYIAHEEHEDRILPNILYLENEDYIENIEFNQKNNSYMIDVYLK